jgi:hypothetical protein
MLRCPARQALTVLLALVMVPVIALGEPVGGRAGTPGDVVTAAREYRASLERLLPFNEDDVTRATVAREKLRGLFELGIVSRRDVQDAEARAAAARAKLDQTRAQMQEADTLITEALAAEELSRRPPTRASEDGGGIGTASAFTYFDGHVAWSLALTPTIDEFFSARFGRALPVSAFGQTRVHDRLGFDHRNALDVAVHPDSAEGRALMAYLRAASISFLAFRGAVPGVATGAHIHIGPASARVAHAAAGSP